MYAALLHDVSVPRKSTRAQLTEMVHMKHVCLFRRRLHVLYQQHQGRSHTRPRRDIKPWNPSWRAPFHCRQQVSTCLLKL